MHRAVQRKNRHNKCSDKLECYSAGTELKARINQDAVRLIKEIYGIDMAAEGHRYADL